MDEQLFARRVEEALDHLYRRLARAADEHGFDVDLNNGTLTVEFDSPPARFVVSPNSPVRQMWVSANVRSFKLDWRDGSGFVLAPGGQDLAALMAEQISVFLGDPVAL
jgi:CyaY protein